eukprot:764484-Hanusia_phi.AAC.4
MAGARDCWGRGVGSRPVKRREGLERGCGLLTAAEGLARSSEENPGRHGEEIQLDPTRAPAPRLIAWQVVITDGKLKKGA